MLNIMAAGDKEEPATVPESGIPAASTVVD